MRVMLAVRMQVAMRVSAVIILRVSTAIVIVMQVLHIYSDINESDESVSRAESNFPFLIRAESNFPFLMKIACHLNQMMSPLCLKSGRRH